MLFLRVVQHLNNHVNLDIAFHDLGSFGVGPEGLEKQQQLYSRENLLSWPRVTQ